jgi:hypothetical protein
MNAGFLPMFPAGCPLIHLPYYGYDKKIYPLLVKGILGSQSSSKLDI